MEKGILDNVIESFKARDFIKSGCNDGILDLNTIDLMVRVYLNNQMHLIFIPKKSISKYLGKVGYSGTLKYWCSLYSTITLTNEAIF